MAIQTTSNLSSAVRAQYLADYIQEAEMKRLYSMYASWMNRSQADIERGSSIVLNFLSDMTPETSAISETLDITPQVLRDSTASVTPTSRAGAVKWSETLELRHYTNLGAETFRKLARGLMESVELVFLNAALQGGFRLPGTARASLDAGTAGDNLTSGKFLAAGTMLDTMKVPAYVDNGGRNMFFASAHPEAFADLISVASNLVSTGLYQKQEIITKWELGELGRFKIFASPWAKVFGAAGADHASNANTTLNGAVNALATSIVVASDTNISAGAYLTIGTEETGNTFYETNERVRVSSTYTSGTTVPVIGEGPNGGLRFDHASGVSVRNADSVFPVAFGGPESLAAAYAEEVGPYGEVVGPIKSGVAEQFKHLAFKWYGAVGRPIESRILRGEFSSAAEA